MTPKELSEIDDKVAEAIGRDPYEARLNGFMPSTDWNDAMFAAEKAGLLNRNSEIERFIVCHSRYDITGKTLIEWQAGIDYLSDYEGWCGENQLSIGETGPLAICQAILKGKA